MDLTGIMAQNPEMASLGAGAIGGALAAIGSFHYFHSTDWCAYDRFSMENLRKGGTPRTRSIDPDLQHLLDVQACGKTRMDTATPSSSGGWSLSNRCSVQNLQEVREN
jgi:hypothetical protein